MTEGIGTNLLLMKKPDWGGSDKLELTEEKRLAAKWRKKDQDAVEPALTRFWTLGEEVPRGILCPILRRYKSRYEWNDQFARPM
jgi:hypothetical protein